MSAVRSDEPHLDNDAGAPGGNPRDRVRHEQSPPSPPSRTGMTYLLPNAVAAIAASVGIVVGSLGPWATPIRVTAHGATSVWWQGRTTLVLGALAAIALLTLLNRARTGLGAWWLTALAWIAPVAGLVCLLIAIINVVNVTSNSRPPCRPSSRLGLVAGRRLCGGPVRHDIGGRRTGRRGHRGLSRGHAHGDRHSGSHTARRRAVVPDPMGRDQPRAEAEPATSGQSDGTGAISPVNTASLRSVRGHAPRPRDRGDPAAVANLRAETSPDSGLPGRRAGSRHHRTGTGTVEQRLPSVRGAVERRLRRCSGGCGAAEALSDTESQTSSPFRSCRGREPVPDERLFWRLQLVAIRWRRWCWWWRRRCRRMIANPLCAPRDHVAVCTPRHNMESIISWPASATWLGASRDSR